MKRPRRRAPEHAPTVWQPEADSRAPILAAILERNPIPVAYRLNFLANFYVGPLIRDMERSFGMTRPEWIVLFCLHQRAGLSAQRVSHVSGRPKTSVSAAIKLLQKKKLISRETDVRDGRRQVLHATEQGERVYRAILEKFVAREAQMVSCLGKGEAEAFLALLDKMIAHSRHWAKDY